jgi:pimeloyl-ACP methyl ester carboxylesterase
MTFCTARCTRVVLDCLRVFAGDKQQRTQTSPYSGVPVLDSSCERPRVKLPRFIDLGERRTMCRSIRHIVLHCVLLLICAPAICVAASGALAPVPLEGFVQTNSVRLQYLDWGGSGAALILLHGLGDNPHAFDDFAPAFVAQFHVVALARRGSAGSEVKGPYDVGTLTEDLRGFMDALGIAHANLIGHSVSGNEITEMASRYPERVDRIVYFDAGYDWSDPEFRETFDAFPSILARPAASMKSLQAFLQHEQRTEFRELDDLRRVEADLRQSVVIQRDGSLKDRTSKDALSAQYAALWTDKRRDYSRIHCPALAIYAEHVFDTQTGNLKGRRAASVYERQYWQPFQRHSIERIRHELPNVQIERVPGRHRSFFLTHREQIVTRVRKFLIGADS